MKLIDVMKALSHENRLRILNLINQRELCVCELEKIMDINQSNASRHLRKLKNANIIYGEKNAQWIYYKINKEMVEQHLFIKQLVEKEIPELDICQRDNRNLIKYIESNLSCRDLSDNNVSIFTGDNDKC